MNPTSRMKTGSKINKEKDSTIIVEEADKEKEEKNLEESSEEMSEETHENSGSKDPDIELIKDLDLQGFFFTGVLEHTFDIKGMKVTFKLLSSDELYQTHEILWGLANENSSTDMVAIAHSIAILSRALVKYNKINLGDKPLEERERFIRDNIPGVLINILVNKYRLFETSADEAFEDKDLLKN